MVDDVIVSDRLASENFSNPAPKHGYTMSSPGEPHSSGELNKV